MIEIDALVLVLVENDEEEPGWLVEKEFDTRGGIAEMERAGEMIDG